MRAEGYNTVYLSMSYPHSSMTTSKTSSPIHKSIIHQISKVIPQPETQEMIEDLTHLPEEEDSIVIVSQNGDLGMRSKVCAVVCVCVGVCVCVCVCVGWWVGVWVSVCGGKWVDVNE